MRSTRGNVRSAASRMCEGAATAYSHCKDDKRQRSTHHGSPRAPSPIQPDGRLRVHEHERGISKSRGTQRRKRRSTGGNCSAAGALIVVGERRGLLGGSRPRYQCPVSCVQLNKSCSDGRGCSLLKRCFFLRRGTAMHCIIMCMCLFF